MARKPFEPNARQRALIAAAIAATERIGDEGHPAPPELVQRMTQEQEGIDVLRDEVEGDSPAMGQACHLAVAVDSGLESKVPPSQTSMTAPPVAAGAGTDALAVAQAAVPADFPRSQHTGALPGAAPKLLARLLGGKYIVGLTAEELAVRYVGCVDLVKQLQQVAGQFAERNPTWTALELYERLRRGIEHERHRWKLSPAEAEWVLMELVRRQGWDIGKR